MNNIISRDPVIKLNKVLYQIIGLILTMLACGSSLAILFIPSAVRLSLAVTLLFLFIVVSFRRRIYVSDARCLVMVLAMFAFIVFNSAWPLSGSIIFTVGLALCLFSIRRGEWINYTLNIMEYVYLFYAASTIFLSLNPDVYRSIVVNWYPTAKDNLLQIYSAGCNAGLFPHYSTNAMLISVGIILSTARLFNTLQLQKSGKNIDNYEKRFRIMVILVLMIGLLLTGKRAHIIFVAAAILIMYYSSMINSGAKKRITKIIIFILSGIFLFSILFALVPSLSVFMQRFASSAERGDLASGRSALWELALNQYKENPVFGIGWYKYATNLSATLALKYANYHVHNVYLQLLCETGTVGFAVYMTWFISIFVLTIKNYRRLNHHKPDFYKKANFHLKFSLGFQVFFFLYCFTANPLYDEETYLVYFICSSITLYYNRLIKDYLVEKRIEEERSKEKKLYEEELQVPKWIKWL